AADKHKSARRHRWAGRTGLTRLFRTGLQFGVVAHGHTPRVLTGMQVDRVQHTPRWFDARTSLMVAEMTISRKVQIARKRVVRGHLLYGILVAGDFFQHPGLPARPAFAFFFEEVSEYRLLFRLIIDHTRECRHLAAAVLDAVQHIRFTHPAFKAYQRGVPQFVAVAVAAMAAHAISIVHCFALTIYRLVGYCAFALHLFHPHQFRGVVRLYVKQPSCGIVGAAAPTRSSTRPRKLHCT